MKKAIIAGAASAVLAAMPVVGVFAAQQATVTDTINLTVSKTCMMEASSATGSYNLGTSTVAHEYAAVTGTPMTITCNAQAGWTITATANSLTASGTDQTIPFGAYATDGESVWSVSLAKSGNDTANATIATGFDNYSAASAAETVVVSANGNTGEKAAVSGLIITPSYKAFGAAHQAAGTYSGTIVYTFNDLTPAEPGA
ncbi:hypothetical protein IJG90_03670 [Candidatus Saccharibacteria bacterium]|nr:hypothetical protein [Candidatus Saccharibacteria bacterium]